ncbi:DedA family protein [Actinomarinicola tropica]|uniref:DedA family protein n=1 Tax=Actinomarinicola tropica TaxID=2789776 RepID=A0A5Q2RH97_9ACTN|nr:DedA family protein [Actinomarinicola tropica]QGG94232.1 DedA family protein [Actinomarinicola tropica]
MTIDTLMLVAAASDADELSGLSGWVVDVIDALGVLGVGALTLLENLFPPIPSEVVLPLAGYLAERDRMHLLGAVVAATIGSLIGALALYGLGRRWGEQRVNDLLVRVPLVEREDLDRAQAWFRRHGGSSVLIGRLVPGVRSIVSLPAGFQAMPFPAFIGLTLLGTVAWNCLLVGAGYLLGSQWQSVGRYSDYIDVAVILALLVLIGRAVWRRRDRIGSRN